MLAANTFFDHQWILKEDHRCLGNRCPLPMGFFFFPLRELGWKRLRAGGEGGDRGWEVEWHHQLNGHEFEQTLGGSAGQGSLVCCSPWGPKELDMTERLSWTEREKKGNVNRAGRLSAGKSHECTFEMTYEQGGSERLKAEYTQRLPDVSQLALDTVPYKRSTNDCLCCCSCK